MRAELIAAAVIALSAVLIKPIEVAGESMMPTLRDGQIKLCIRKMPFRRGDIICVRFMGRLLIKRVTAVGGSVYVPTARLLTFRMSVGCMCADGVWKFANNHTMGSVVVHLVVDGSDVYNAEVMVNDFCGVVQGLSYTQVVGAGSHAVRMDYEQKSDTADRILMKYSAKQWPGQRLQVVDEGAA